MTPDQPHDPAGDRRARVREAAIQEIKQAAREHLLRYGPGELSLRAVARDVGVTPSALYRYFDSRGALVTALSADALDSAADAVDAAAPDETQAPRERLRAMFEALRAWSHAHQSEFELLFANSDDQTRPDIIRSAEMQRLVATPLATALAGLVDGSLVPSGDPPPLDPAAVPAAPGDADPALLAQAALVCARCLGWLYLEHFGLVAWGPDDRDAAFAAYLEGALGPGAPGGPDEPR
jgi:AcrR family transcriptional regulator